MAQALGPGRHRADAARWTRSAERLAATMPQSPRVSSVLHNDYKIDNCQFDPANPTG